MTALSVHQVIVGALAHHDPDRPLDVEGRARLIEAALVEFGHLPDPNAVQTPEQRQQALRGAAWDLAQASRHPRFTETGPDGWQRLLNPLHDADVGMAYLQALRHAPPSEHAHLAAMRNLLLDDHREQRQADVG